MLWALVDGKWQVPSIKCHTEQFRCCKKRSTHPSPSPIPGYYQSVVSPSFGPFWNSQYLDSWKQPEVTFGWLFSSWCPLNFLLSHFYGNSLLIHAQLCFVVNPCSKVYWSLLPLEDAFFVSKLNYEQRDDKHLQVHFCVHVFSPALGKYLRVHWLDHGHKNAYSLIRYWHLYFYQQYGSSWASAIAHWVKTPTAKPDNLNLIPGNQW